MGKVEMVNCRALKMEMTVKAWVVSSSTPARVIVRKIQTGAMTEVDFSKFGIYSIIVKSRKLP